MSADLISGLLLVAVMLAGAAYVVKTLYWDSITAFVAERRAAPPRGTNDHLVGQRGRVVDDGAGNGTMRVRVGMESWRARDAGGRASLPIGTEVEVTAVRDGVLEVAERRATPAS